MSRAPRVFRPGLITAVTPTIPPRTVMLSRARASVIAQKRPVDHHAIAMDWHHAGPGATRNHAMAGVDTEWVAFLDDDDAWMPHHIRACESMAYWSGADVIYPIGRYSWGDDPLGQMDKPFNPVALRAANFIPVTVLARTELVLDVGGFPSAERSPKMGEQACEDWGLWLAMLDAGATFAPLHQVTWVCGTHDGLAGNLSGATWVHPAQRSSGAGRGSLAPRST